MFFNKKVPEKSPALEKQVHHLLEHAILSQQERDILDFFHNPLKKEYRP